MTEPTQQYVLAWVEKARRDLGMARSLERDGYYDGCALHCQQAAEKALKARHLALHGRDAPKTHKLVELATLVDLPDEMVDDLHDLERDYMTARYPDTGMEGPQGAYTAQVAADRLAIAEAVVSWVVTELEKEHAAGDAD